MGATPVTLVIEGLDQLSRAFEELPQVLTAGVKVTGEAAVYWAFWEWGKVSIKPGPKTMYSTNMLGEEVVLTITAPRGYVRANHEQFEAILREEFKKIRLSPVPTADWKEKIQSVLYAAAQRCAVVISDSAPKDTGQLYSSIVAVSEGDGALEGTVNEYYGSTEFDLGVR